MVLKSRRIKTLNIGLHFSKNEFYKFNNRFQIDSDFCKKDRLYLDNSNYVLLIIDPCDN